MARTRDEDITIPIRGGVLHGFLAVPPDATGIVVFAHGSGSSRHSLRNRGVAEALNDAGFATLLFDLLTEREDAIDARTREFRFDIPMLGERLSSPRTGWRPALIRHPCRSAISEPAPERPRR